MGLFDNNVKNTIERDPFWNAAVDAIKIAYPDKKPSELTVSDVMKLPEFVGGEKIAAHVLVAYLIQAYEL